MVCISDLAVRGPPARRIWCLFDSFELCFVSARSSVQFCLEFWIICHFGISVISLLFGRVSACWVFGFGLIGRCLILVGCLLVEEDTPYIKVIHKVINIKTDLIPWSDQLNIKRLILPFSTFIFWYNIWSMLCWWRYQWIAHLQGTIILLSKRIVIKLHGCVFSSSL